MLGVALGDGVSSCERRARLGRESGEGARTSRRRIRSLTTAITRPIVAATSALVSPGSVKSIVWPSRRRPRDRSWLLMYSDACRRLSSSTMASSFRSSLRWCFWSGGPVRERGRRDGGLVSFRCCFVSGRRGIVGSGTGNGTAVSRGTSRKTHSTRMVSRARQDLQNREKNQKYRGEWARRMKRSGNRVPGAEPQRRLSLELLCQFC